MVQLPKLKGEENWAMFKQKMKAVMNLKGCVAAIDKNFETKLPDREDTVLDLSDDDDKKKQKALEQNAYALNIMTLAMESEELMAKIPASATEEFPSGRMWKLWESLEEEYEPSDVVGQAELLKELMQLQLGRDEDPKNLIEKMAAIQARYNCKVSVEHLAAVVVNAGGVLYAETIRNEKRHLEGFGKDVTSAKLVKAMHEKYRIGKGPKKEKVETGRHRKKRIWHL